jgi:hypothetical protein
MIHLVNNDRVNLGNFEAFMTSLEEAYRDPDRVNTAKRALSKLRQGYRNCVAYYVEFQRLIADLDWNDAVKRAALHRSLSEDLKDILSTQDLPEEWSCYVALVKKCDMQYRTCKAKSYHSSGKIKSVSMPASRNASPVSRSASRCRSRCDQQAEGS